MLKQLNMKVTGNALMCYTVHLNICPLVFLKGNQNVTQVPISIFHYMKEYFHITLKSSSVFDIIDD